MFSKAVVKSLSVLTMVFTTASAAEIGVPQTVIENVGFKTPESVEYYGAEDLYLVANINGSPLAEDDNGFISKVAPDGKVLDLKWLDGATASYSLNAPKGMAIVGELLFVADINQVHVFEVKTGKHQASIAVAGSSFLNGVTVADKQSV